MKKIILILLTLITIGFAQETVWESIYYDANGVAHQLTKNGNLAVFSSGTYYSKPFVFGTFPHSFTGLFGLTTRISQPSGDSNVDTLTTYIQIWTGKSTGWVSSDSLELDQRHFEDDDFVSSKYKINDSDDADVNWYWVSLPDADYSILAIPYKRVRVKIKVTGSGTMEIGQEITWINYER